MSERQFKVVGPTITNAQLGMWHYSTLESANQFAEFLAKETHARVMVLELIGSWQIKQAPVEYVSAAENPAARMPEETLPEAFTGPANPCMPRYEEEATKEQP